MHFIENDLMRFYTFPTLEDAGVTHAVFTRRGGVSPDPWASLNLGGTVGDEPVRVAQNREKAFRALNRDPNSMYDVWQVHSAEVVYADAPRKPNVDHRKVDAIITDRPTVTLFMRFADCVPILLYDPIRHSAGIVHSGWPGTVKKVARVTIKAMHDKFGTQPGDILAGIGPSICFHHYDIGPEVEIQVRKSFGEDASELLPSTDRRVQFDLWAANRLILEECGVHQIELAGLCTACHLEDWYSHRGEKGHTGRFGVLIGLNG